MNIDTTLWNNPKRMRARIKNLATLVITLAIINLYVTISSKSWIVLAINVLYAITTIPIFISYTKWEKEPPQQQYHEQKS